MRAYERSIARRAMIAFGATAYFLFLIALFPKPSLADFTGSVVSILDGDTIEVLYNNRAERIRLSGIDCPEKGQAYGQKAKHAASGLAFGKEVTLQTQGLDKYGRTFADVLLPDGTNVNHELVKDGWCWWSRKYAQGDTVLEGLEKGARGSRKGLWADPQPVLPWEWRKRGRWRYIASAPSSPSSHTAMDPANPTK
jgi:micrococcal nuclease